MNAHCCLIGRRDEARRASRRRQQARQRAQERQRRMDAIIALAAVIGLLLALGVGLASTPQHVAHADTAVTGDAAYTVRISPICLIWRGAMAISANPGSTGRSTIHRSNNSSSGRSTVGTRSSWRGSCCGARYRNSVTTGRDREFCWQSSWQRCGECTASWRCHVNIRTGCYRALGGGYDLPQTARRHR